MSKLDVAVGDEFPLDEGEANGRRERHHRYGRHRGFHGHHHHRHHHGHGHHHVHILPLLLIGGGIWALVEAGKVPSYAAYGLIGLGLLFLILHAVFHLRAHRGRPDNVPKRLKDKHMHGHHHRRRFGRETVETENGERATTRVQLEMPPQAMERLQKMKDRTEAASYAEVIRNALRLFEALVDEHEKGAEFSLKRPDGEIVQYKIFV